MTINPRIFCGIDGGKSGAVAFIYPSGAVNIVDAPTFNVGKGSRRVYDEAGMVNIIRYEMGKVSISPVDCRTIDCPLVVGVESVHSMPGQGVASMFSQGEGFGIWKGILAALGVSWQLVTPQRWKKALMDGQPKEKAASVVVASRLFPNAAHMLRGPRGAALDGRADALLIAAEKRLQAEIEAAEAKERAEKVGDERSKVI